MEFNRLLSQAISFYGEDTKSPNQAIRSKNLEKVDTKLYECVTDENLERWVKKLEEQSVISVDTETTSINPVEAELVGLSFSYAPNKACYIPVQNKNQKILSKDKVIKKVKSLLEDVSIKKVGQNLKYDYIVLLQEGINLQSMEDTMLISYTLDAGLNRHNLNLLSENTFKP